MDSWRHTTLGTVLTLQRGFDITRRQQRSGDVPVVSSGGIGSYHDTAAAAGPGVVIGRKGTLGQVFYLPGPYWPHDTTLWVKDFKASIPRFVYYYLKQLDTSWLDVGSANPTLNRNHLHPLKVHWPPSVVQRAIVEVLGALDDKIAANLSLAAAAEQLALTLAIGAEPTVPLGNMVTYNKVQSDPSASTFPQVAHFSLPAFDAGRIADVVSPREIRSSKFAIEHPCVLVSKLNPRFPRMWDVPVLPSIPALASTEFLVLVSRFSSSTFLWALLRQPSFSAALESKVSGTSGSHQRVRPDDLLATLVPDPREFAEVVRDKITGLGMRAIQARRESTQLAKTRDVLLPALMSGRLRICDAESIIEDAV